MDGELAGTKRVQGSDRRRGEEMKSEEEKEKKRTEESWTLLQTVVGI